MHTQIQRQLWFCYGSEIHNLSCLFLKKNSLDLLFAVIP